MGNPSCAPHGTDIAGWPDGLNDPTLWIMLAKIFRKPYVDKGSVGMGGAVNGKVGMSKRSTSLNA